MKYEIEYACGHTAVTQLFGRVRDRERKIEWLKTQDCPDCYKAKIQQKREQENAEAAEKSKALNLPELEGSEKQIAWANTIRMDFLEGVVKERADIHKHLDYLNSDKAKKKRYSDEPVPEEKLTRRKNLANENLKLLDEFEDYLKSQTKASWWIDRRDNSFDHLARDWKYFVKEGGK